MQQNINPQQHAPQQFLPVFFAIYPYNIAIAGTENIRAGRHTKSSEQQPQKSYFHLDSLSIL